jgi:hypothetical protein
MKRFVPSLLGAATLAMSANALALDTTVPYLAFISHGFAEIPVGVLAFELFGDIPLTACQYAAEWDNAVTVMPLSGQIVLDETKTVGNASCPENSILPVLSLLTLDKGGPSFGFDDFEQFQQIFLLMAGESRETHDNEGLIQFTGAVPVVYGFELHP